MISTKEQQSLLIAISEKLSRKITVFAIGGTAMMFWGFKDLTLDIDLVFTNSVDRKEFINAARVLDYNFMDPCKVYGTKNNQPVMLERATERFDLFLRNVIHFSFSEDMEKRAEKTYEFGDKLIVKIADPHDIIIMKAATDRIKDIDDIRSIIEISDPEINWDVIIKEAENQIKLGNLRAVWWLPDTLLKVNKNGIKIPEVVFKKVWSLIEKHAAAHEKKIKLDKSAKKGI